MSCGQKKKTVVCLSLALGVGICLFTQTGQAQGSLDELKSKWQQKQYDEVLSPLIDFRLARGKEEMNFELDYMIAVALCNVESVKNRGCQYFAWMMVNYSQKNRVINGRSVNIPKRMGYYCRAEVDGRADTNIRPWDEILKAAKADLR